MKSKTQPDGQTGVHVRCCHMCGHVNEGPDPVGRCEQCGKMFAPFFYFSDQHVSVFTDNEVRPPDAPGELRPIRGLTVHWPAA